MENYAWGIFQDNKIKEISSILIKLHPQLSSISIIYVMEKAVTAKQLSCGWALYHVSKGGMGQSN